MNNFYKNDPLFPIVGSKIENKKRFKSPHRHIDFHESNEVLSERDLLKRSGHLDTYVKYLASKIYEVQSKKYYNKTIYSQKECNYRPLLHNIILLFLFININIIPLLGQGSISQINISPLKVGDTIPEELWQSKLHAINTATGKNEINLIEYRDRELIILDFWATWCAPCITSLDSLNYLQNLYGNKIHIQPITYQKKRDVEGLVTKRWQLSSVIQDSLLKQFFPHKIVPHQVWIKDNRVIAVVGHKDANIKNIDNVLNDQHFSLSHKKDILNYSSETDLASLGRNLGIPILSSSVFTGHIEGIPYSMGRFSKGDTTKVYFTNMPIVTMYQDVLQVPNNRILLSTNFENQQFSIIDYFQKDLYCYQLKYVNKDLPNINQYVINELNNFFKLKVDSSVVETECFIVFDKNITSSQNAKVAYDETKQMSINSIDTFIKLLNFSIVWKPDQPIFINETSSNIRINHIDYNLLQSDYEKLKETLSSHRLDLRKEKRKIMFYRISPNEQFRQINNTLNL